MSVQVYKIEFAADTRQIDQAEIKLRNIGADVKKLSDQQFEISVDMDTDNARKQLSDLMKFAKDKKQTELEIQLKYQVDKKDLQIAEKKRDLISKAYNDTSDKSLINENVGATLSDMISKIRSAMAQGLDISDLKDDVIAYTELIKTKFSAAGGALSDEIKSGLDDIFHRDIFKLKSNLFLDAKTKKQIIPSLLGGQGVSEASKEVERLNKEIEDLISKGATDTPQINPYKIIQEISGAKIKEPPDFTKWSEKNVEAFAKVVKAKKIFERAMSDVGISTPSEDISPEDLSAEIKKTYDNYVTHRDEFLNLQNEYTKNPNDDLKERLIYLSAVTDREYEVLRVLQLREEAQNKLYNSQMIEDEFLGFQKREPTINKQLAGLTFSKQSEISRFYKDATSELTTRMKLDLNDVVDQVFNDLFESMSERQKKKLSTPKQISNFKASLRDQLKGYMDTLYVPEDNQSVEGIKDILLPWPVFEDIPEEIEKEAQAIEEGAQQLEDAKSKLNDAATGGETTGVDKIADEITDGSQQIEDAADKLDQAAEDVREAERKLNEDVTPNETPTIDKTASDITDGSQQIEDAATKLDQAADDVKNATGKLNDAASHGETSGIGKAADEIKDNSQQIDDAADKLDEAVQNVKKAKNELDDALGQKSQSGVAEEGQSARDAAQAAEDLGNAEEEAGRKAQSASDGHAQNAKQMREEANAAKAKAKELNNVIAAESKVKSTRGGGGGDDNPPYDPGKDLKELQSLAKNPRYLMLEMRKAEGRGLTQNMEAELDNYESRFEELRTKIRETVKTWDENLEKTSEYERELEKVDITKASRREQYIKDQVESLTKSLQKTEAKGQLLNVNQDQLDILVKARNTIEEINNELKTGPQDGEVWSGEELSGMLEKLKDARKTLDGFGQSSGVFASTGEVGKLLDKVNTTLSKYSIDDDVRQELENIQQQLRGAKNSADELGKSFTDMTRADIGTLENKFRSLSADIDKTRLVGKNVFETIASAASTQTTQLIARWFSLSDLIRYTRQMITTVTQIDTAMKELQKVSGETASRIDENFRKSADTAKDLGASIKDVISSTADWSRLGYDIDAAEDLARVTTMYQNIALGIDQKSASEYLVSTLKGFQMQADEAESIIDKINEVAQNWPIDQAGIGEALQRSAAAFSTSGTSLDKAIALVTSSNSVLQNPEKVGTQCAHACSNT